MQVTLRCVDRCVSRVVAVSLPMPPFHADVQIAGASITQAVPLGQWPSRALLNPNAVGVWNEQEIATPDAINNPPRRCLVYAQFPGNVPDDLKVTITKQKVATKNIANFPLKIEVLPGEEIYHHRDETLYHYVRREDSALISGLGAELMLRLAWRIGEELRYWQWVQIIPVWRGELTQAFVVGGHLYAGPVDRNMTMDEGRRYEQTPFSAEATIAARAFVVLHADGQMELTVHYANTEAYGNGCAVDGVPVVEIVSKKP